MTIPRRAALAAALAAAAIAGAPTAYADPDIDFANQLQGYGIYGPRDYNAWLGKITCKRLARGVDPDAYASVSFIAKNLDRTATQAQAAQFLGAAVSTYCPDMAGVLQNTAQ
ncbi:MAG: DUF732 domain-containing protein [Mycobacterium sp.]